MCPPGKWGSTGLKAVQCKPFPDSKDGIPVSPNPFEDGKNLKESREARTHDRVGIWFAGWMGNAVVGAMHRGRVGACHVQPIHFDVAVAHTIDNWRHVRRQ